MIIEQKPKKNDRNASNCCYFLRTNNLFHFDKLHAQFLSCAPCSINRKGFIVQGTLLGGQDTARSDMMPLSSFTIVKFYSTGANVINVIPQSVCAPLQSRLRPYPQILNQAGKARDKRSSLLRRGVTYGRKKFCNIGHWSNAAQALTKFCMVFVLIWVIRYFDP